MTTTDGRQKRPRGDPLIARRRRRPASRAQRVAVDLGAARSSYSIRGAATRFWASAHIIHQSPGGLSLGQPFSLPTRRQRSPGATEGMNFDECGPLTAGREQWLQPDDKTRRLLVSLQPLARQFCPTRIAAAQPTVAVIACFQYTQNALKLPPAHYQASRAHHIAPQLWPKKPLLPLTVRTQRTRGNTRTTLRTRNAPIFTFDGRTPPVALAVAADRIHGAET